MSNPFKPELLAPAGNLETAVAAFSAGADAVYLGLGKFNARNRAENFQVADLARLISFAHQRQKKVYVTLNTLINESELPELLTLLGTVSNLDIDALIVQDLAVIYLVRKYFPEITLHASTQMNIHNSCGIAALRLLGVKRVILERQITLEELRIIAGNANGMELEVFIHGSLCLSLSGRCLISNYAEKASGNRGMCRQLCRRNYRTGESSPPAALLSPKDLQLMEMLPEFARLKIASLKIEGRLRGPDYVVPVVKAYRQALDSMGDKVPEECVNMIRRTVSRPASNGSLEGFGNMIAPEPQAVFGRCAGVIQAAGERGISVKLSDRIHLGDKLRIVSSSNSSLAGFELTGLWCKNSQVSASGAGSTVFIPGRFPFMEGRNYLYKIGENGYDFKRQAAALPPGNKEVKLDILLDDTGFCITAPDFPQFEFHSETLSPARSCALSKEDIRDVFTIAEGQYRGKVNSLQIKGEWFCAKSVLKKLKKELFIALMPHLQNNTAAIRASRVMHRFYRDYAQWNAPADLPAALSPEQAMLISGFIAEGDLPRWYEKLKRAKAAGQKHFAVGGLHGIMLLKEVFGSLEKLYINAVYPLAVSNSAAARLLKQFQLDALEPWVELPQDEVEKLQAHSPLPLTEPPPDRELLVTRLPLKFKRLLDKNGSAYRVVFDPAEKLTRIYGAAPALEIFRNRSAESDPIGQEHLKKS
ncbi:MAG: U32 family peptidase [Lentisphaerae bacterium]|nr:U32 family peptidase [Lentisphaerota bacterium]